DSHHPSGHRNLFRTAPVRVTGAVDALVVRPRDDWNSREGLPPWNPRKKIEGVHDMRSDLLELREVERTPCDLQRLDLLQREERTRLTGTIDVLDAPHLGDARKITFLENGWLVRLHDQSPGVLELLASPGEF